jgi:hypothetical protein
LNVAFERLKSNIIPFPFVSNHRDSDGCFYAYKTDRDTALTMPMIQVNGPRCIRYLCFDIDRKFGALAWEDGNLPLPNFIMTNPKNGHAHLIYEIDKPIWKKRPDDPRPGDAPPVRYLEAVLRAMQNALQADKHYSSPLVKNPLHSNWIVTCGTERPYTLGELSAHLDLISEKKANLHEDVDGSRNCTLFCSLRYFAYRVVNDYRDRHDFTGFKDVLLNELERLNTEFPLKLPLRELCGIMKSVAKWTWNKYHGNGKSIRRGVMGLRSSDLSLREKQQLSQKRTCQIRVEKTEACVVNCIVAIQLEGCSISISEINRRTKLSRNTIRRYWSKLNHTDKTVSLRDKFTVGGGAMPPTRYPDPTHLITCGAPRVKYFDSGRLYHSKATQTFESGVLDTLDKWRQQEFSMHEQRTTF